MNEMVERVEYAICNAMLGSKAKTQGPSVYRLAALAAIAVMRAPTAAMIAAGEALYERGSDIFGDPGGNGHPEDVWPAMVDAALAEEKVA